MKKILFGFLGIAIVAAVVSASAYALFSSQATETGITITSGSANLMIGNGTPNHATTVNGSAINAALANVYPGYTFNQPTSAPLDLFNTSSANIDLSVTAQITSWTSTQGNWSDLANDVSAQVCNITTGTPVCGNWYTLQQWHDYALGLPGAPIPPTGGGYGNGGKASYVMNFKVNSNAGNEIANTNLSNMTITFTGTQVNP